MKMKRYIATDMRSAMAQIKQELGPEAMILSNRRMGNKIEVITAIDYDEAMLEQMFPAMKSGVSDSTPRQENDSRDDEFRRELQQAKPLAAVKKAHTVDDKGMAWSQDAALLSMREELESMKETLSQHLDSVQWQSAKRSHPHLASVLSKLKLMGLQPEVAQQVVRRLPDSVTANDAFRHALGVVSHMLPTEAHDLDAGGVIALVGATGVGKTTTIAKMAARFSMRHGSHNVALISTDETRIGAYEQLNVFGQILGVPVYRAANRIELDLLLKQLSNKRLVLIDTQGFCRPDLPLPEELGMLSSVSRPVQIKLLISADMQLGMMERVLSIYQPLGLSGMVLTKLDEAMEYGSALSVLLNNGLPLMYVTDGQNVPKSLHAVNAQQLVFRALKLAKAQAEQQKAARAAQRSATRFSGATA